MADWRSTYGSAQLRPWRGRGMAAAVHNASRRALARRVARCGALVGKVAENVVQVSLAAPYRM